MKGHLTLVLLNKYGGIVETMGHPSLEIEDNRIEIYCAEDDINHLGETMHRQNMITLYGTILAKDLPNLYVNFNNGFGSNFAYNYASFNLFKRGALEYLKSMVK